MRLISVGLISCITLAQTATAPQSGRAISIGMGFSGTAYGPPAITGAAYSAQEVTEHVQTLADGTHIKLNRRTMLLFRDSQGRTRTERPIGPPGVDVRVVEINDPVAGFRYVLDPANKVVHRTSLTQFNRGMAPAQAASGGLMAAAPPPPPPPPPPPTSAIPSTGVSSGGSVSFSSSGSSSGSNARPQHTVEQLGSQMMEGVMVEGRRDTTVIPVGLQGNDQPMTTVTEVWSSPQLHLTLLRNTIDPRSGTTTTRIENLIVGEPDASLILPPGDYTITDETGNFQIHFSR